MGSRWCVASLFSDRKVKSKNNILVKKEGRGGFKIRKRSDQGRRTRKPNKLEKFQEKIFFR